MVDWFVTDVYVMGVTMSLIWGGCCRLRGRRRRGWRGWCWTSTRGRRRRTTRVS